MSNQLPISPVTGKPSGLTAQIRRSVGIIEGQQAPAPPVKRQQAQLTQRGPSATELAAAVAQAMAPLTQAVGQLVARVDQVQQAQVQRAATTPTQPGGRGSYEALGFGSALPMPETGVQSGYPTQMVIVQRAATTPAGMAMQSVAESREGRARLALGQPQRTGMPIREAVRRSLVNTGWY